VRLRGEAAARDQLARDQQALIDRLRATQAAQRESEARFRNMADNAPVMMWITDPDGSCTYLNRRWYEFTGQAERAGEGYGWLDAVHPDDHAAAEEAFVSANAERRDYFVEFRVRRADGTYRWAIDAAAARFDDEGAFLGYVGSVIDIDERKEVEIALRRSEAKLRAVVDAVPVGVVLAEAPAGRIVGGNAQAERIFGHPVLTSPDIESYREWVAQHPDGRPVQGHEYPLAKVIGGEADRPELEVLYWRGEGRDTWIRLIAAPIRDETGAVTGGVVAALDIDREKRTEAELRDLNETLEARVAARTLERDRVWKNSRDLLVVIDTQGIFQAVNPAWTSILGWETDELVGRCFLDFIHPDDQPSSRGALATASVEDLPLYDNRYRHKDGSHRWISWLAAPAGDLIYAYGRDGTAERTRDAELEVAQDALRQAQKMEAVGQLTGGVAHDFNNLLTVIKSSTDLLKRPNLPDERRARYIAAISDTADRAAKLTGQLLAFARRQALRPEVFDVGRSVRNLADMLGMITGSRIAISLGLPDETCCVNADPSQFDTALVNMAINARDAMGGEGCLTLTVWPVHRMPAIRSHKAVTGEFVAVSITDTGSGIAPQVLDRIFEPFFTTKGVGQGTGLGLSQVFGFAKQSGGEITVESELGRGSTFTLYLPRTVAGAGAVDDREPEVLIDGHGTCVLVVEDNVDVGTFARQTLSDLGYHTVLAANAGEALAELAKDAGRFDVVFSDVVMPGMSGIELGQEIRGRHPDLPVVLTSGYSHVLAPNGTSGFELLHKPYSVEDLSRVLRTAAGWRRRKRLLGQ